MHRAKLRRNIHTHAPNITIMLRGCGTNEQKLWLRKEEVADIIRAHNALEAVKALQNMPQPQLQADKHNPFNRLTHYSFNAGRK